MGTAALEKTDAFDASSIDLSQLTPLQLARLDEALAGVGVLTFREYMSRANAKYVWYPHCEIIASVLQRVADLELRRVLFLAPPRTGKSEPISRVFPAYWLYRYPETFAGLTSYTANLALNLSKRARANYLALGGELAADSAAASEWMTSVGGGMWAAGFGGSMLGKGMHLGVVDDPLKNAEEAGSELIAMRNLDFWTSTFRTRLEPGGAIVVVLQRWPGVADFVQQLMDLENGDEPERWHVVCLEGEKEEKPLKLPESCTLEPDFRTAVGQPLCPERLSPDRMRQMREQSPYFFAAQVQQRPRPREGVMFPRDAIKIVEASPVAARRVRYWDKAGTEGGGKFTAGVRISIDENGLIFVEDVVRAQHEALARRRLMRTTAELDGETIRQKIEREPGSSGKDSASDDVRNLAGFPVTEEPASGDKVLRADPLASQWQAGNVRLVRGPWNKAYLDELEAFPHGSFKDQVDASSGAYNDLAKNNWWMV